MAEVAVAIADVQEAGRGRQERSWQAPPSRALLLSAGFRPAGLAARHGWRLGAIVGLAMLEAAEAVVGLPHGAIWLKWPNDIVATGPADRPLKVAGVLGEATFDVDGNVASAVVGIGVNVDWPATEFPPDLAEAMTSLHELASGGRPVDRERLLDAFLPRLDERYAALRIGRFDAGGWSTRQLTTGRHVEVDAGNERFEGRAIGVDTESGALRLKSTTGDIREFDSGEVTRCRLA